MHDSTEGYSCDSEASCETHIIRVNNILWTGLVLWKIPFHSVGNPQRRILNLKKPPSGNKKKKNKFVKVQVLKPTSVQLESVADPLTLELIDPARESHSSKRIRMKDIVEIKEGQGTHAFQAFKSRHGKQFVPSKDLCFSIICSDRTYDLYTDTPSLTAMLIEALRGLLKQMVVYLPSDSLRAFALTKLRDNVDPMLNQSHFFVAVKTGDVATVLWYLQRGFPVDTMENTEKKDTALLAACRLGRTDIVEIALKYDAKNDPHPYFGQTALQVAVASGHVGCVRAILEAAAESGADCIIVNHEDCNKEAPIHVASRCGNIYILELLIDHGAIMTLVDAKGRNCLHCATQSGYHTCLDFLLSTGCKLLLEERDDQGYTSLHIAVKGNKLECARTLLEHGAAVHAMTKDGRDSFMLAKKLKSDKMLQTLIRYGDYGTKLSSINSGTFGNCAIDEPLQENLFEGLDVFNICGGVSTPYNSSCPSPHGGHYSVSNYPVTPIYIADDEYETFDGGTENKVAGDQFFYYNNHLWYVYFSSGHYFFLREVDNHSQVR